MTFGVSDDTPLPEPPKMSKKKTSSYVGYMEAAGRVVPSFEDTVAGYDRAK